MANRPIDDFDPRNPDAEPVPHDRHEEMIDDEADFGGGNRRRGRDAAADDHDLHDDADFVDDDMNDIVDDTDPLADEDDQHAEADDEEDHDYSDDEESEGEATQAARAEMEKSRSGIGSLIFYVIIAAVIAGGGYMAYNTFMNGGEPVSPGTVLEAAGDATEKAADKVSGVVVPTDNSAPTPAPVPADNTAPIPGYIAANPTPTDTGSGWQTTLPNDMAAAAQPMPQPVAQPAQPTPVAPTVTPSVAPSVAPAAGSVSPTAVAANTEAMAAINARLAETERNLAQMTASVSTLTQNLQASQAKVAQLEQRPASAGSVTVPPSGSVGVSASDLASLRQENSSLQRQIEQLTRTQQSLQAQMQADTRKLATTPAPASTISSPKQTSSPKPASKPAAKAAESAVESSSLDAQDAPRSPKTRAPTAAAKTTWVLRAATPGMAWVSPQPGSSELKRVVPGDQLAGIGQITAIRQDNGRWIVEGSNGTVR